MSINVQERVLKIPIPLSGADGSSVQECSLELPTGFPEIHKIVYAEGIVNPQEPVTELGQVLLKGKVDIGIIYSTRQGEETIFKGVEFPAAVEYGIPVDVGEVTPESQVKASVQVESVTASAGKDRLIKCDVVLTYEVETAKIQETKVLTDITGVDQKVEVSKETNEVKSLVAIGTMEKVIDATLALDKTDLPLAELLRVGVAPRIEKSRCLAGKVVLEGALDYELVYQPQQPELPQPEPQETVEEGTEGEEEDFLADFTDSEPAAPKVVKKTISSGAKFVLSKDIAEVKPEMVADFKVAVVRCTGKIAAPDQIEVSVELKAEGSVYDELALDSVVSAEMDGEDRIDLNRRLVNLPKTVASVSKELVVNGSPGVPASKAELKEVLAVKPRAVVNQCKVNPDRISVSGKVFLDLLYLGENELGEEVLDSLSIDKGFDFKETFELVGVEPGMLVKVDADVATAAANILDPFTLEANILLTLAIEAVEIVEKEMVMEAAIAVPAPADGASLRVVVVQKGDTLWKLARKYGTTMEFIAEYNKLDNLDDLVAGQRLRIPSSM